MKKLITLIALALSLSFFTSACSPRLARGIVAAAIVTHAVAQTAAEVERTRHYRRHRHSCSHYHDYYDGTTYECTACH